MSIIPPNPLTTVQLVSGLFASAKNAVDLAKTTSNRELQGAVSELLNSVMDVKVRVVELDEQVRELKAQLAQKDEIVGPEAPYGYFFYKDKPDQPLCPKCLQSQPRNPVFLQPLQHFRGGTYRRCMICGIDHQEIPETHSEAAGGVAVGRESLFHQSRGYSW